jgi:hypothetical protein
MGESMKITFADGIYYATHTTRTGKVCMGYSPIRLEAMEYCAFKFGGYKFQIANMQTFKYESKLIDDGGCFDLIGETTPNNVFTIT